MRVWDRQNDIAEAIKQLKDESSFKSVKFKDEILQHVAEKRNDISKVLSQKIKLLKNN